MYWSESLAMIFDLSQPVFCFVFCSNFFCFPIIPFDFLNGAACPEIHSAKWTFFSFDIAKIKFAAAYRTSNVLRCTQMNRMIIDIIISFCIHFLYLLSSLFRNAPILNNVVIIPAIVISFDSF